jgi:CIC family chloride channel protein
MKQRAFVQHSGTYPSFTAGAVLAIVVGAGGGLGAVAFTRLIYLIQSFSFGLAERYFAFLGPYWTVPVPVLGGLVVGLVVHFLAQEAKGHGVPEVMFALGRNGGRIPPALVFYKTVASVICIGTGGSAGKVGPGVQIGSTIGSSVGQLLRLPTAWIRTLVLCGAAAGLAGTFNAPLGGLFFVMEILTVSSTTYGLAFIGISSVTGGLTASFFYGTAAAFPLPTGYAMTDIREIPFYLLLGLLTALAGGIFIRSLRAMEVLFNKIRFIRNWLEPSIGAVAVGFIGLYSYDLYGVGYGEVPWESTMSVESIFAGSVPLQALLVLVLLKIAAVTFTLGSGGSGGIFAPSLFMGAAVGGIVGHIAVFFLPEAVPGTYTLAGAAAFFAGVARAPLTGIILIIELTRNPDIIIPLLISVLVSVEGVKLISRETVYTEKLKRLGVDIIRLLGTKLVTGISVGDVMTLDPPTVRKTQPISGLRSLFTQHRTHGLAVVNEEGRLCGMVTVADLDDAQARQLPDETPVESICTTDLITAFPDETLAEVLPRMFEYQVGRIPIVDPYDHTTLLGMLRERNVINAWKLAFRHGERSILADRHMRDSAGGGSKGNEG